MPKKIKYTPGELLEKWKEYKAESDARTVQEVSAGKVLNVARPRVYTLESFLTLKLEISRQAWSEYCKRKSYKPVTDYINELVFARKKEAMVNGEGHVTGLIFDMKANYGINDKTIIDATIDGTIEVSLDLGGGSAAGGGENDDTDEEKD